MKRIPVIMIASLFVIGIPAITQSDPVPKKMVISMCFTKNVQITGRSVTYFKRNKRMDVWKTDGKGTLFRSGVWHMEEIKGNPKSQEAYETSKQV